MDEKALKKIIKQLVRESLTEIFAEMKLENIVETVVSKKVPMRTAPAPAPQPKVAPKLSVREALNMSEETVRQPASQPDAATRRRVMMEKLGVNNDMWKDIYADTASSDNPILEGDQSPQDREEVPASILESMGLMRDYSKHIGQDKKTTDEDEEWRKRREARAKILNESIKRT